MSSTDALMDRMDYTGYRVSAADPLRVSGVSTVVACLSPMACGQGDTRTCVLRSDWFRWLARGPTAGDQFRLLPLTPPHAETRRGDRRVTMGESPVTTRATPPDSRHI